MIDREPVQAFDLRDELRIDHVVIYPLPDPDEPSFEAIPFIHEGTHDDGTRWLNEADEFDVTDEYRHAVALKADVPVSDLKLERELETYGFSHV